MRFLTNLYQDTDQVDPLLYQTFKKKIRDSAYCVILSIGICGRKISFICGVPKEMPEKESIILVLIH